MNETAQWTFTDSNGKQYKNEWAAVYNPYANTSIGQNRFDWFYFDENGYMMTGWILYEGKRYCLSPVSDGTKGRMLTGWQLIDGNWYYFNEVSNGIKGALAVDTWIGEYYVNPEGIWEEDIKPKVDGIFLIR